jgi:NAD(P)H-hydrate epimerase
MRILTASQMREADRRTIEEIGIPSIVLMENAGRQVVAAMEAAFEEIRGRSVAIVCGRGQNGGDGFVVARTLVQRGAEPVVFLVGRVGDVRGDARINLEILGKLSLKVIEIANEQDWELHGAEVADCDVIVDALLGTGAKPPLAGLLQTIVADLNAAGVPIVSIDLPTGLAADTEDVRGEAVDAFLTVTLAAPKLPLVLPPGERKVGKLVVADIGIPSEVIDELDGPRIEVLSREGVHPLVQPRQPETHKGDYGRVLVVGGSRGKSGAAHLTALAALRSGAGLVTLATPLACQAVLASMTPEYMTEGLPETDEGAFADTALERLLDLPADVIALGPGVGRHPSTVRLVQELVARASVPLVVDADGLNAFERDPGALQGRDGVDIVITPHPGEMARLVGSTVEEVQAHRIDVARTFATTHRLYVVLKGHRSLVATPEGDVYVNMTGNPGMAKAGSGDVLTGVMAAWLAQLLDADAAARLAVYLHGAAGDLAEADEGETAMLASDVIDRLGDAVLELTARRRTPPPES